MSGFRLTASRRLHMRSSHPSLGGASGMKSQSAPEASADTKARYLEKQSTSETMTRLDSTFQCGSDLTFRSVKRRERLLASFLPTRERADPLATSAAAAAVTVWNSPTVSAHHLQNKSALVAVRR